MNPLASAATVRGVQSTPDVSPAASPASQATAAALQGSLSLTTEPLPQVPATFLNGLGALTAPDLAALLHTAVVSVSDLTAKLRLEGGLEVAVDFSYPTRTLTSLQPEVPGWKPKREEELTFMRHVLTQLPAGDDATRLRKALLDAGIKMPPPAAQLAELTALIAGLPRDWEGRLDSSAREKLEDFFDVNNWNRKGLDPNQRLALAEGWVEQTSAQARGLSDKEEIGKQGQVLKSFADIVVRNRSAFGADRDEWSRVGEDLIRLARSRY